MIGTSPQIVTCIVGDRSHNQLIRDTIRAAGLPLSDRTCEQVDFTRRDAETLRQDTRDPDDKARIKRYMDDQIDTAAEQKPHYAYADHEYPDHSGLKEVVSYADAGLTGSFIRETKYGVKARTSLWNCVGIYNSLPVTTQSSIDTFELVDRIEELDWVHINGYIKKHIDTDIEACEFINRLVSAITLGRSLSRHREVLVSFMSRIVASTGDEPLTSRDIRTWWQTVTALGQKRVLWYIPTGKTGEAVPARLREIEEQAPAILAGIESVGAK